MKHNRPKAKAVEAIISIAKVQGMAKRNNIKLVDASAELYGRHIAFGVAVRKPNRFSDAVTVRFYNFGKPADDMVATMRAELQAAGFDLLDPSNELGHYSIAKAGA